jgi:hypothetical protein
MREHTHDIFQKHSYQPWIILQDHQELSQINHIIPNKLTKTYISFHGEQCILEKLFLTNAYDTKCMQYKIQGCLYIMLHMPCQMQEMHKGKLHICYKESSHTQSSQTTGSSRGGKKGLDTTGKRAKEHKNSQAPPKHMHLGQRAYKAHPTYMR